MRKILVVAKSDNDVIGRGDDLPWHLPADHFFFTRLIRDGFLLTGRVSFQSPQGREIFENRRDVVVITRRRDFRPPGVSVAHSPAEGLAVAAASGAGKVYILGGAEIYRQTLDLADELVVTEVHARVMGDSFFPPIDPERWIEVRREDHARDRENPHDYSFVFYKRRLV